MYFGNIAILLFKFHKYVNSMILQNYLNIQEI